jgi:hypothetical protein
MRREGRSRGTPLAIPTYSPQLPLRNRRYRTSNLGLTPSVGSFVLIAGMHVQEDSGNDVGSGTCHAGYCFSARSADGPRDRSRDYE